MRARATVCRWAGSALLLLLLTGCRGGGGSSTASTSPQELAFLFQHNARFLDGHTIRWPDLPIQVHTAGIGGAEGEVQSWTRATGGAVSFAVVGSPPGEGITFRPNAAGPGLCAITVVNFDSGGRIRSVTVALSPIFTTPQCVRTVAHETGHAIGFLDHTADGGLMDPEGGNGEITAPVANMIRLLYSLPPGTPVAAGQVARGVAYRFQPGGTTLYRIEIQRRPGHPRGFGEGAEPPSEG